MHRKRSETDSQILSLLYYFILGFKSEAEAAETGIALGAMRVD